MSERGDAMDVTQGSSKVEPADVASADVDRAEAGTVTVAPAVGRAGREAAEGDVVFDVLDVSAYYGDFRAIRNITLPILDNEITALIGPSGCGKTTFIRCLNRMNDLIPGARIEGAVRYHGIDLYDPKVDPVEVRRRI